jgi:radical SAM-linked protein
MQRLRLRFGRTEELRYISHTDVIRAWERSFRRVSIPLAYSQGFTPHPQISIAAPLAVGMTSDVELMDIRLTTWMPPQSFTMKLAGQIPRGFQLLDTWIVGLNFPSLQSILAFAEYIVVINTERKHQDVQNCIKSLLRKNELPWFHHRAEKTRYYDLRALIDDIWIADYSGSVYSLGMRLCCGHAGSGRPEQVVSALDFCHYPVSIHRSKLILEQGK